MATIKLGAIVTDIRGKLGGHVFQKGNKSRVMKTYAKSNARQTDFKTLSQNFVNRATKAWTNLNQIRVDGWNEIATNYRHANRFGDMVSYTGASLFRKAYVMSLRSNWGPNIEFSLFNTRVLYQIPTNVQINLLAQTVAISGGTAQVGTRTLVTFAQSRASRKVPNIKEFVTIGNTGSIPITSSAFYERVVARQGAFKLGFNYYFGFQSVNSVGWATATVIVKAEII